MQTHKALLSDLKGLLPTAKAGARISVHLFGRAMDVTGNVLQKAGQKLEKDGTTNQTPVLE